MSPLEDEIQHLRSIHAELAAQHNAITSEINAYRALLSPGRRLPTNVLQAIFIASLSSHTNSVFSKNHTPILLTQICQVWRQVALDTPDIWSSLHLPIPIMRFSPSWAQTSDSSADARLYSDLAHGYQIEAKKWLDRSIDRPLSISLVDCNPRSRSVSSIDVTLASNMINLVVLFTPRWQNIRVKAHIEDLHPMLALPLKSEFPILQSLSIECIHPRSFPRSYISGTKTSTAWKTTPLLGGAPNLRKLTLIDIRQSFLDLPVKWGNLISLTLEANPDLTIGMGADSGLHYSPSAIASILSQCFGLTEFRVDIFGSPDIAEIPLSSGIISLPRLESLEINSYCSDLIHLFRSLDVPHLRRIEFHSQQPSSDLLFFLGRSSRNGGTVGVNILSLATSPGSITASVLSQCPNLVSLAMKKWRMSEHDLESVLEPLAPPSTADFKLRLDDSFLEQLSGFPVPPEQNSTKFLCPNLCILSFSADVYFSDLALLTFIKNHYSAYNSGSLPKRLKRLSVRFRRPREFSIDQELQGYIEEGLILELWYPREVSPFRPKTGLKVVKD